MLCVKCKTAIDESSESCPYCGEKINRRKTKHITMALFFLCLVLLLGITYFTGVYTKPKEDVVLEQEERPAQVPEEKPQDEAPALTPTEVPSEGGEEDTASEEKTVTEIEDTVNDIAASAQEFYEKFGTYAVYVTNKGYLYEYLSGTYIKASDFEGVTGIKPENINDDVLLLYLKTADLADYPSLSVTQSNELVIFASYETKDGFIISSANNGGGLLPREDLRSVLDKYSNTHGAIKKVEIGSDDYNQISALIGNMYTGSGSFDFRYLFRDGKYCVAVTSPKGESTSISEHVLYCENNTWYMAFPNYEMYEKSRSVINTALVDINLELVPGYNLTAFKDYLRSDYTEVIRAMKLNSLITEEDEPMVFQSGTDDFCYLESASGRKFVGNLSMDSAWDVKEITNYEQGAEYIKSLTNRPPLFILKQY
ncbi:MAG: zinc ribbon domain-containing protein [Clostridiales bacterium]|nr:zinc ribbon domain-containing protein [Clostridiales bacterium]